MEIELGVGDHLIFFFTLVCISPPRTKQPPNIPHYSVLMDTFYLQLRSVNLYTERENHRKLERKRNRHSFEPTDRVCVSFISAARATLPKILLLNAG